ncbi:hypothetical protein DPV78_011666 [Talaromyces pinophilus]|nr:hypothetical protein DPV78_011666 [Talaromyces pinophilus]
MKYRAANNKWSVKYASSRPWKATRTQGVHPRKGCSFKQLREKDKLPWSQVQKHFRTQTAGEIQVRYYTALKDSTSPSIKPVLQNRMKGTLDTTSDVTSPSRPVRAHRAVERYSP